MNVILTVNYNSWENIHKLLGYIKNSNIETLPFVLIVDNNSQEKLNSEKLDYPTKSIQVLLNDQNVGFARANNIGVNYLNKNIRWERLLIMNNDVSFDKNYLKVIFSSLSNNQGKIITTAINQDIQNSKEISGSWFHKSHISNITGRIIRGDKINRAFFLSGCMIALDKKVLQKLDQRIFSNEFFMYYEDVEFSIRVFKKKIDILFLNSPKLYHKVGDSQHVKSEFKGLNIRNPNFLFQYKNRFYGSLLCLKIHPDYYLYFISLVYTELFFLYKALIFLIKKHSIQAIKLYLNR